ncbi:MAG: hypothetical protein ACYDEO_12550 [Aggregatilineales bacterium]
MQLAFPESGVEISTQNQKVSFLPDRDASGSQSARNYLLTTHVRHDDRWEPMFGAKQTLLSGPDFELIPTTFNVIENSSRRIAILLSGAHTSPDYNWDVLVEAYEDNPWLRFRITCHLNTELTISSPEPSAGLWMGEPADRVTVDQGPISIYGGHSWGNSFPAAYLWADGKEAVIFFNLTSSSWMSSSNLKRFLDYHVATLYKDGYVGLGLHALSKSGNVIPRGHLVLEYYLFSGSRQDKPTTLEALDTTVHMCASLLPATVPLPENHVPPYELRWKCFADNVITDLMRKDVSWVDLPSSWNDGPAFPENQVPILRVHSDYATNSSRTELSRSSVLQVWDYATCNNFLAPWIAYQRLNPNPEQEYFLSVKRDNVPLYYQAEANLFRWGASGVTLTPGLRNSMANGIEMSWENFMFHLETAKIHNALPPDQFNPAIPGRFLMACYGLIEYAHNVNYIFPQWFDAFSKTPMMQLDIPALGKIREPFQVGSYAYIMLEAYALTGEAHWLDEAQKSIKYVLNEMQYREVNSRYVKTFTDAVEVPIAETFGNGYAVAAAQRIYNVTGNSDYLNYAKHYLNILVRMVFWYKDDADATSRDLNNLGLFRPHGGHYGTCPWENIEAYLPLTVFLKFTRSHDELLLKLFNLQRINSFYYFPPVWTSTVAAPNPELYDHVCQYLPVENFYTLEFGGTHGSMGRCIYMCSPALWNYLLYEAFATTADPEVMVLNLDLLDGYDAAMDGTERTFIVYNPTDQIRNFTLTMNSCADGKYNVSMGVDSPQSQLLSSEALSKGLPITLGPLGHLHLKMAHENAASMHDRLTEVKHAQAKIAHAYQMLQQAAEKEGFTQPLATLKERFIMAQKAYREQSYRESTILAQEVIAAIGKS